MTIPRAEHLRIIQRVHAKWTEIYDDRDDFEANEVYYKILEEAMAEASNAVKPPISSVCSIVTIY